MRYRPSAPLWPSSAACLMAAGTAATIAALPVAAQSSIVLVRGSNEFLQSTVPANLGPVTAVSGGYAHTVVLRADGTVRCWGAQDFDGGQCSPPAGLANVVQVDAGGIHTVARTADGAVVCWGFNDSGQCTVPAGLGAVDMVAAGAFFTMAQTTTGAVQCWGANDAGQCTVPSNLGAVIAIDAGYQHAVALRADGSVRCWGDNASGQCAVPSMPAAVAISAGAAHTVAIVDGGQVRCWGLNASGQCTPPDGLDHVVAVAAGARHTVALRSDGTVVSWGSNQAGQRNILTAMGPITALAAGDAHTVALTTNLRDCDGNGTPDLLAQQDALVDCNQNLLPDCWDIEDGRDTDLDGNGVPDSCPDPCAQSGWLIGQQAPDFAADALTPGGKPVATSMQQQPPADAYILAVCGTWCVPCVAWSEAAGVFEQSLASQGYSVRAIDLVLENNLRQPPAAADVAAWRSNHWTAAPDRVWFGGDISMDGIVLDIVLARDPSGPPQLSIPLFVVLDRNFVVREYVVGLDPTALEDAARTAAAELDPDCNADGTPNLCEIASGALDCNGNTLPDACEIASGSAADANGNGVPDECDPSAPDCNGNGIPDRQDIAQGIDEDCNGNGVPDLCDIAEGIESDCNGTGFADSCEILAGWSQDANGNGIPDECDPSAPDCNGNGIPDADEIADGSVPDCNGNGVPDACDLKFDPDNHTDCDGDGVPDSCTYGWLDCDLNGVHDVCDIAAGSYADMNGNAVPDPCECIGDLDQDQRIDGGDLAVLLGGWGPVTPATAVADLDGNGLVDGGDLAAVLGAWGICTNAIGDEAATAIPILPGGTADFSTRFKSPSPQVPADGPCRFLAWTAATRDIWFRVETGSGGSLGVDLCASGYDTSMVVYQLTGADVLTRLACDDDTCQPDGPGYQSRIDGLPVSGTILIRIGGYDGTVGDGTITVSVAR